MRGIEWTLLLRHIYEGPAFDPNPEIDEPIPGSELITWHLTLLGSDGSEEEGWWDPRDRILSVRLRGWSGPSIGMLKQHLIRLGERPRNNPVRAEDEDT